MEPVAVGLLAENELLQCSRCAMFLHVALEEGEVRPVVGVVAEVLGPVALVDPFQRPAVLAEALILALGSSATGGTSLVGFLLK